MRKRQWSWGDEEIVGQSLDTGTRAVVLHDAVDARYVSTGHLVFMRRGVLYAIPFDPKRLRPRGPEVPVLDGVAQSLTGGSIGDLTGAGQFAVGPSGALAWLSGAVVPPGVSHLVTVDRRGQVQSLPAPPRSYGAAVRLSPDHGRLAVTVTTLTEMGFWVHELRCPAPLLPLKTEGEVTWPLWSPGGQDLFFRWLSDGQYRLVAQVADGAAPSKVLLSANVAPSSTAPDGRIAAVRGMNEIVVLAEQNGKARLEPPFDAPLAGQWPAFSPDGRWLLYGSDVSGRSEIYVRPSSHAGSAVSISAEGGAGGAWHPSGREIFFLGLPDAAGKRRMMAVDFTPGSPPTVGRATELFSFDPDELGMGCIPIRSYEVAADGQHFYTVQRSPIRAPVVTHINLITNWFEELKAKVPMK